MIIAYQAVLVFIIVTLLNGCASANKLQGIHQGMQQEQVVELLGSPDRLEDKQQIEPNYVYALRQPTSALSKTLCVLLPLPIPTLGIIWASDSCLGERGEYRITFKDKRVVQTRKINH